MMKYGGTLQKELVGKYVEKREEEYRTISKKYLDEIMSHRDEYQEMFEEYFQKYKDAQAREEFKDAEVRQIRSESDAEIQRLEELLKSKEKRNDELKQQLVLMDAENEHLNVELATSLQDNILMDRDLNISEAKVECAYQKKMEVDEKVKTLSAELLRTEKQIKGFTTTKCILSSKIQGMDKRLDEYREEVAMNEVTKSDMLKQINDLKSSYERSNEKCHQVIKENEDLYKVKMMLEETMLERKKYDAEMYDKINAVVNDGHKKCFLFRKQSKKILLFDELKLMFENKNNK